MPARFEVNEAALRELLRGGNGPVVRHINQITRRAVNEAKRRCPVDTGLLRSSITGAVTVSATRVTGRIGTNVQYARYVHDGRGPIVPRRRRFLRFKPKGSNTFVYARRVGPQPANPFLLEGLRAASPYPARQT